MTRSWNKGFTKYTHPSVLKISETMRKKKLDNFFAWRERMRRLGRIPNGYPPLEHDARLAELIGVVLGDGNIHKFPRTECLTIASNANNAGFIARYAKIIEEVFDKKPYIGRSQRFSNCIRLRIYQKEISKRLGIPIGSRKEYKVKIARWIWSNKLFLISFLRGLYEAEGSFCVHRPTSTYKLLFSNRNPSLLKVVYRGLRRLGFHPHCSRDKIQLSKKNEVYQCKDLIQFRNY